MIPRSVRNRTLRSLRTSRLAPGTAFSIFITSKWCLMSLSNESSSLRCSIESFLESLSAQTPEDRRCPQCGATVSHANATFWLEGVEKAWDVRFPVCDRCTSRKIEKRKSS